MCHCHAAKRMTTTTTVNRINLNNTEIGSSFVHLYSISVSMLRRVHINSDFWLRWQPRAVFLIRIIKCHILVIRFIALIVCRRRDSRQRKSISRFEVGFVDLWLRLRGMHSFRIAVAKVWNVLVGLEGLGYFGKLNDYVGKVWFCKCKCVELLVPDLLNCGWFYTLKY